MRLLLLLVSLFLGTFTTGLQADVKLMLLGVVFQKEEQRPIKNITVCLEAKSTNERTCFTTLSDGCFYFSLEKDKQYFVHLISESDSILTSKEISTLGKEEPEIMHMLLEY